MTRTRPGGDGTHLEGVTEAVRGVPAADQAGENFVGLRRMRLG